MNRFPIKISYGIMATVELAKHENSIPLQAKLIAKRQGIPSRFIEQVLQHLKQAGIVRSLRGAQGGYILAKHPGQISLADLVVAMNGSDSDSLLQSWPANGHPEGRLVPNLLLAAIWQQVREAQQAVLQNISIQHLAEQYQKLETRHGMMYHI